MNYRNISQLNETIIRNIDKIPYDVDLVVGIPRSGIIPANLIALYRNVPFVSLTEFENGVLFSGGERLNGYDKKTIKKVLVVDDSFCSGNANTKSKQRIAKLNYDFEYIYTVIYIIPQNVHLVDVYFEVLPAPRVFQWNILHHGYLSKSCVDIDGVLCVDPTEEENDDGEKYINFILNAKPLFLPKIKIHTLISCRLEKYRKQTELWLNNHNIQYENLILMDLPDKETRIRLGNHAKYKGDFFKQSECILFIESNYKQAQDIFKISKKSVFCIETFEMLHYQPFLKNRYLNLLIHPKDFLKKVLNKILTSPSSAPKT